jgi:hypothetical protein
LVTAQERVRRNAEVFNARARGLSWPTVAARYGLSERQCRRIVAECRAASGSLEDLDANEIVRDTLESYDARIEDLALLAEETEHAGAKLGAVKARLHAIRSKWELMRAIGVLPADLGRLSRSTPSRSLARSSRYSRAHKGISMKRPLLLTTATLCIVVAAAAPAAAKNTGKGTIPAKSHAYGASLLTWEQRWIQ